MLLTPAQIKLKSFEMRLNYIFTRGGCASRLRACLGARLLLQSYQYPNLSEGADLAGGQLRGDKECPFSGVTKSGRVGRKVPESDARCVLTSRQYKRQRVAARGPVVCGFCGRDHVYFQLARGAKPRSRSRLRGKRPS